LEKLKMNDIVSDVTSILMSIIGVAILAVLVKNAGGVAQVIESASSGFSKALGTAMGNRTI
jgi:hypothetical protein